MNCKCTVVQKSHRIKVPGSSGRNIIIIRNPYDTLIAYFNWYKSKTNKTNDPHIEYAPPKSFKSKGKPTRIHTRAMLELTQN